MKGIGDRFMKLLGEKEDIWRSRTLHNPFGG